MLTYKRDSCLLVITFTIIYCIRIICASGVVVDLANNTLGVFRGRRRRRCRCCSSLFSLKLNATPRIHFVTIKSTRINSSDEFREENMFGKRCGMHLKVGRCCYNAALLEPNRTKASHNLQQ